jgi:hypothetical protein
MKKKADPYCFETINDELNKLFNPGKFKLEEEKTRDIISEIRVEEVHDFQETKVFWRVYYTINERIVILGESEINPQLIRHRAIYL